MFCIFAEDAPVPFRSPGLPASWLPALLHLSTSLTFCESVNIVVSQVIQLSGIASRLWTKCVSSASCHTSFYHLIKDGSYSGRTPASMCVRHWNTDRNHIQICLIYFRRKQIIKTINVYSLDVIIITLHCEQRLYLFLPVHNYPLLLVLPASAGSCSVGFSCCKFYVIRFHCLYAFIYVTHCLLPCFTDLPLLFMRLC